MVVNDFLIVLTTDLADYYDAFDFFKIPTIILNKNKIWAKNVTRKDTMIILLIDSTS